MKIYNRKTGQLTDKKVETADGSANVPVASVIHYRAAQEPESFIEWADVNRVGMAIRSAKGGGTQPLFALYRDIILSDSHIQSELSKRKLAVIGDTMRVIPYDKKSQADIEAATFCERQIYELKGWKMALAHLLDGVLFPVSVAEKVFTREGAGYRIGDIGRVPAYLLDYSEGNLHILNTKDNGEVGDGIHYPDPYRYIIHRGHLLSTPDQFGGPMRSLIYWWLASTMSRDWWVRFLERYGTPFILTKYAPGNEGDRNLALAAMSAATRTFGLAVSNTTEVEIKEATKTGPDAYAAFMAVAQREKSKLILGQTLSAQTDSTGLGSGVADLQGEVREDIRQFDASMLAETIRDQLLTQIVKINRLPGRPPYIVWGGASNASKKATAELLGAVRAAGLRPADSALESISEDIGFDVERDDSIRLPFAARPQ